MYESDIEELVIELLGVQGYTYLNPEDQEAERENLGQVLLLNRLKKAVEYINPQISSEACEQAIRKVINLPSQHLMVNNETFHRMLTEGIDVEVMVNGDIRGEKVWLVDFDHRDKNDFVVCNQFTVIENNTHKRPDVVVFINGLPLVVIELKNPADENATVQKTSSSRQNCWQMSGITYEKILFNC